MFDSPQHLCMAKNLTEIFEQLCICSKECVCWSQTFGLQIAMSRAFWNPDGWLAYKFYLPNAKLFKDLGEGLSHWEDKLEQPI